MRRQARQGGGGEVEGGSFSAGRNDRNRRRSVVGGGCGENGRQHARIELKFQSRQLIPSYREFWISSCENCISAYMTHLGQN
jgi:hypothetical protein